MLWYSFLFIFTFVLRYNTIRYSIESLSTGMPNSSENLQTSLKGKRILTSVSSHSVKQCRAESVHTRNAYSWLCICSHHYSSLLVAQSGNSQASRGCEHKSFAARISVRRPNCRRMNRACLCGFLMPLPSVSSAVFFPSSFLYDSTGAEPHFVHNFM